MNNRATNLHNVATTLSQQFAGVVGELAATAASLRNAPPESLNQQTLQVSETLQAMRATIQTTLVELPNGQMITLGDYQALIELARLNGCDEQEILDGVRDVNLKRVARLDLSNKQLTEVSPLAVLTNLDWLEITHNRLTDVSPLAFLTKLQLLCLGGNKITDLSPIAALTNLQALYLEGNTITDASPLAVLTNVEELDLAGNEIVNVSPLASLTNLIWLNLGSNQITDAAKLASLSNLRTLAIKDNPLAERWRILQTFRSRGVTVYA